MYRVKSRHDEADRLRGETEKGSVKAEQVSVQEWWTWRRLRTPSSLPEAAAQTLTRPREDYYPLLQRLKEGGEVEVYRNRGDGET